MKFRMIFFLILLATCCEAQKQPKAIYKKSRPVYDAQKKESEEGSGGSEVEEVVSMKETSESVVDFEAGLDYALESTFKFPLHYAPPTSGQLRLVMDSLGEEAVKLLNEQTRIYFLFEESKQLWKQVQRLQNMADVISPSSDYKSNTRYLRKFNDEWIRLSSLDSMIIHEKLLNLSPVTESLKYEYSAFNIGYKSMKENPVIKDLKGYDFEAKSSAKEQSAFLSSVLALHNDRMPVLINAADTFMEKTYEAFNSIYDDLNRKFPTYRQYINP